MNIEERQRRLDRVGHAIRVELAIGFLAPVVLAFMFVTAPGTLGGGWFRPWWVVFLPWIGTAGVVFGLAWMVRLSRPNPEGGERDWRYRDF
jgi:hypothetical protein